MRVAVFKAGPWRRMKDGVMLINTSRGALGDMRAVIDALKTGKVGAPGLDVYEEEAEPPRARALTPRPADS